MIKSVLLPVDGSAYTESVLRHGVDFGRSFGALLRVLSVVDVRIFEWVATFGVDGFVPVMPSPLYREETEKVLQEKAEKTLESAAALLEKEGVRFTTEKLADSPVDAILERQRVADLVIMGQRGEYAKWESRLLGATVEAVSRQIEKPLMVVHQKYRQIRKILLSYDGSRPASRAMQFAGAVAEKLKAAVEVLTVHRDEEWARRTLAEAEDYLKAFDCEVRTQWISGDPDEAIPTRAADGEFDLVVIGGYGHSRLREAILGSTTVHVMRNSPVPVCLVK